MSPQSQTEKQIKPAGLVKYRRTVFLNRFRTMSDIGILNDPLSLAVVLLLLGAPGLPLGAVIGAWQWRRHRVWGALIGAVVGFALWLIGWLWLTDNL
jgi:Na+/proline symporter